MLSPHLFVLERASGTHNYAVTIAKKFERTHLHVLCSVPVSSNTSLTENKKKSTTRFHAVLCLSQKGMVIIMKGKKVIIMLSVFSVLLSLFSCKNSQKKPYNLPPISDFILALNEQDINKIESLVSNDVIFKYTCDEDEEYSFSDVKEAILTMRNDNVINILIYEYYGDFVGEKNKFPKKAIMCMPIKINEKSFFIDDLTFYINDDEKIYLVTSNSIAFKYLFSIESRELI